MSISYLLQSALRAALVAVSAGALVVFSSTAVSVQSPRFYPDDPIERVPESQSVSIASAYDESELYELVYNLFVRPGYKPSGLRAADLNTVDEVPDSSWFTNRVGSKPVTIEALSRGPNAGPPPDTSKWVLVRQRPGRIQVSRQGCTGRNVFLEFDCVTRRGHGRGYIATRSFGLLGTTRSNRISTFPSKQRSIPLRPFAVERKTNQFSWDDVNAVLETVARNADEPIGHRGPPGAARLGFSKGTHGRSQRSVPHRTDASYARFGLRRLDESHRPKAANTMDTVITENGKTFVKHYLQDVVQRSACVTACTNGI